MCIQFSYVLCIHEVQVECMTLLRSRLPIFATKRRQRRICTIFKLEFYFVAFMLCIFLFCLLLLSVHSLLHTLFFYLFIFHLPLACVSVLYSHFGCFQFRLVPLMSAILFRFIHASLYAAVSRKYLIYIRWDDCFCCYCCCNAAFATALW